PSCIFVLLLSLSTPRFSLILIGSLGPSRTEPPERERSLAEWSSASGCIEVHIIASPAVQSCGDVELLDSATSLHTQRAVFTAGEALGLSPSVSSSQSMRLASLRSKT